MAPRTARVKKEVKPGDLSNKKKSARKIGKEEVLSENVDLESVKGAGQNGSQLSNDDETKKVTNEPKNGSDNKETITRGRGRKPQKKKENLVEEQLSDQENHAANNATYEVNPPENLKENPETEKIVNVKKPQKKVKNVPDKKSAKHENEDNIKNVIPDDKPLAKAKRGKSKKNTDNQGEDQHKKTNAVQEITVTKKRGRKAEKIDKIKYIEEDEQMNIGEEEISGKTVANERDKKENKKNEKDSSENKTMEVDPHTDNVSKDAKSKSRGKKIYKKEHTPEENIDEEKIIISVKEVNKVELKGKAKKIKAAAHSDKAMSKQDLKNDEENKSKGKNHKKVTIEDTKDFTKREEISDIVDITPNVETILNPDLEIEKPKGKGKRPRKQDSDDMCKGTKLDAGAGDYEDEPALAVNSETQPRQAAKGKRHAPKKTQPKEENESQDVDEPPTKKIKSEEKKTQKNKTATDYESIDFSNSSKNSQGQPWNLKISSWNVGGIRAWLTKGGLDYIKQEKPDILCLQEVKCSQEKLPEEVVSIPGYHPYWLCSEKDGYAGVAVYTAKMAINVQYGLQDEQLDAEGRLITAEYEQFYLISTYVPNAGRNLVTLPKRLKWNEVFHRYVKELDAKKPVIICGDMNVAHNEIDLTNPKANKKNAGFTQEERAGMTTLLNDGFIDTFRQLNPDKTGAYTFWSYMGNNRAKNVGWRLDYLIISERLLPTLCDSVIRSEVFGSDHCPISLFLHLSSVPKIPTE